MTKVKFEEIKLSVSHSGLEKKKICNAEMIVNNKRVPVQLQRSNTGMWVAIGLESKKIYLLSTNNKESFEDWLNDSKAELCGVVPQPD